MLSLIGWLGGDGTSVILMYQLRHRNTTLHLAGLSTKQVSSGGYPLLPEVWSLEDYYVLVRSGRRMSPG
jgi:hypothetical protein